MSSAVNELPSICCPTVILPARSLPDCRISTNEDDNFIDQLNDRFKPSNWVHANSKNPFQFRNEYFHSIFSIIINKLILHIFSSFRCSCRHLVWPAKFVFKSRIDHIFNSWRYNFNSFLGGGSLMAMVGPKSVSENCFSRSPTNYSFSKSYRSQSYLCWCSFNSCTLHNHWFVKNTAIFKILCKSRWYFWWWYTRFDKVSCRSDTFFGRIRWSTKRRRKQRNGSSKKLWSSA